MRHRLRLKCQIKPKKKRYHSGTGAAILNAQEAENVNLLDEFDGFRLFVS